MSAVETLPNLHGKTHQLAERALGNAGFKFVHTTGGGYREYRHSDDSVVWMRPNGEVMRLGPRIAGASGKKYRRRYDQHGKQTDLHSTGEMLTGR